jgi:hypothetical protein
MLKTAQLKTNIILFPNRNKTANNTLTSTNTKPKEQAPKATAQNKDDEFLLIFEMLLTLKEQLDSIQTQLNSLSER